MVFICVTCSLWCLLLLDRYYPPDYDPSKMPRGKKNESNDMKVLPDHHHHQESYLLFLIHVQGKDTETRRSTADESACAVTPVVNSLQAIPVI